MAALIQRYRKVKRVVLETFLIASRISLDKQIRCSSSSTSALNLMGLSKRGLIENVFPGKNLPDLVNLLASPQSLYCGFDPTANSLHIGNLLSLIVLLHGQRAGHSPIAVVGGATALIGDPSGRKKDRDTLNAEDIENNILAITENIERVFSNHQKYIYKDVSSLPGFRILNNSEWYKDTNVISFLSTTGRHFRVGEMMSRHSVKSRLNSPEGISCTEFLYQLFQAYDWLHLFEKYNCSVQVGGNDQTGNISSGFDLIHKVSKKCVFGLLVPLLVSADGRKLGKTENNTLWLDPSKTSPYELYQHYFNVADSEVERYLKLFTFISLDEIQVIMEQQNKSPEQRHGQKKLAEQITLLVHGDFGLASALRCTEVLFGNSLSALSSLKLPELQQLFKDAPTTEILYDPELTMFELCLKIKCFKLEGDAERIIKAGGLYLNEQRMTKMDHAMKDGGCILSSNITLVRVGKKNYHIVKWLM